jgi:hypothetical protein
MQNFRGRLTSHANGDPDVATIQVDGDWVRIVAGHRRLGAWRVQDVHCERVTVFRFQLTLDGVTHTFSPDDPAGFSGAVGAVIDLRPKSRFGLGDRVKAARAEAEARALRPGG